MSSKYWLSMTAGDKVGYRYAISEGQGTIGRDPVNAIQIIDEEVSRIHGRFQVLGGLLEIADLQSANGTFVNDKTIKRCQLNNGDLIKIGATVLEVQIEYTATEPPLDTGAASQKELPARDSPSGLSYFPKEEDLSIEDPVDEATAGEAAKSKRMAQIAKDMSFIYRASLVASSNASPDEMLNSLTDLIFDWLATGRCCVLLRDKDTDPFSVRAIRSHEPDADHDELRICQYVVDYVCEQQIGILTHNTLEDQRLSGKDRSQPSDGREVICVPIHGRNEFQGVLYIDAAVKPEIKQLNKNNLKLMIAIGRQIGFAIENEQYVLKLREQQPLVNIGQTTSSLTHHVKNVLQGIYGGSHIVETGLEAHDIQTVKTGWAIVNRNQQEISNIVSNMLLFGNPYDPHFSQTDLNEVITKVFEEIGPSLDRRKIQYEWNPDSELAIAWIDQRGIYWAVHNLVSCCATACHRQTHNRIKVTLDRSSDNNIVIVIADNRLSAEKMNVDDPFSSAMSEPVHNMNEVEFAVSQKLIQGHGGQISVNYSESEGNVFLVQLPLNPFDPHSGESVSAQ